MELGFSLKIWMPCLRLWFPNHPPLSSTKSPPPPASRASPGCSNVGATSPPLIAAIACRKSPTSLRRLDRGESPPSCPDSGKLDPPSCSTSSVGDHAWGDREGRGNRQPVLH
nr:hypothetical protein Itr_chr09CG11770 [Ipomoea trifida]